MISMLKKTKAFPMVRKITIVFLFEQEISYFTKCDSNPN